MIEIAPGFAIPDAELGFAASRSGGPGGQNVNKVATRVTLTFDVGSSPSLTDEQRSRIRSRLARRISKDGVLQVVSQRHRTQGANRAAALARFVELLQAALAADLPRLATRPSRGAKERRVEEKKLRARAKESRRRVVPDE
ncbi:MAG: alternative ribosome rescue aminoacyl-tRNA hydrolase ArfB [Thermoanaerobaculaceae bacterium]|nr:alternative ribosome rescue aminoacyl-tRNA hydrolase ArfB [Thermoanaerobaculaceae bacterium]TAM55259.1 MAG: aminoacyl-tRNA hydrolase [Acidobacteriota bacterium]